jgi:hypothetical protein
MRRIFRLGLYRCFVQQHYWDVVLNGIDALALRTLEGGPVLDEFHLRLAVRAGQYLEKFRIDGHMKVHYTRGVCVLRPADVIIFR